MNNPTTKHSATQPSAKKNPAIKIDNLSFAYNEALVLNEVNCQINSGEFVGIIGPNGGGKTTLLKLMMGLYKPSSGTVHVLGKPPQQALDKIAYVPQTTRFDKQFPISVLEVVLMGLLSKLPWYGSYSSEDKKAALAILEEMGIAHLHSRAFGTLSGGQAQRTLIARALISKPSILLLDEPTASVDAQAQSEIYLILESLKGKMTIIMVTHDLKIAIEKVEKVFCVQQKVCLIRPQDVCEHFAFGLYHPPLVTTIGDRGVEL